MQSDYCPLFIASEMGESNRSSNLVNSLLACEMTPRNLSHNRNAELRMLCLACQICVFFMITQIVGGCLANSLVIATGALYLFSDVCSFLISTVGVITAQLQPTDNRMFGCHRAEILVASTSVIVIWFVTGNLSYLALERLLKDDIKVDSKITMITAIIGLVANAFILVFLHGICGSSSSHVNSHATDPLHDIPVIDRFDCEAVGESDLAQRVSAQSSGIYGLAAVLYAIREIFLSVGIYISSIVIMYKPEWTFIDPACALFFGLFIIATKIRITIDLMTILMGGLPKHATHVRNKIVGQVMNIPGVVGVHNVCVLPLTPYKLILSMHLIIYQREKFHHITKAVLQKIRATGEIWESTVQIEHVPAENENCEKCEDPHFPDD